MRPARRVPRWSAARRARPKRGRVATFVCVARAGPAGLGTQSVRAFRRSAPLHLFGAAFLKRAADLGCDRSIARTSKLIRHPESLSSGLTRGCPRHKRVYARLRRAMAGLEGCRSGARAVVLRGPLRGHLRTETEIMRRSRTPLSRHCEERQRRSNPGAACIILWIASRSLSSGRARRADPLARNDELKGHSARLFSACRFVAALPPCCAPH